jgi:hypothetical protein
MLSVSIIIHRFTEGEEAIGVAETSAARAIVDQLNSGPLMGGGTVYAKPVSLLTLSDTQAVAEFIEDQRP